MDKKQREARRRQEDMALNRALLWVGGAIILEVLLLFINRYYINFFVSEVEIAYVLSRVLRIARIAGSAGALLCLFWFVVRFCRGMSVTLPIVLTLVLSAIAVCSHVAVTFQQSGMRMLFLLVPAWAGLALVYYLYHRDFFLSAIAVGMSILGLWFIRFGGSMVESALILAGIVLVSAVVLWLKKTGGLLYRPDGSQVRVLAKNTSYPVIFLSCLASLVCVVAGLLAGSTVAYYLIFVMVAWLFALLVYYTVKLM